MVCNADLLSLPVPKTAGMAISSAVMASLEPLVSVRFSPGAFTRVRIMTRNRNRNRANAVSRHSGPRRCD